MVRLPPLGAMAENIVGETVIGALITKLKLVLAVELLESVAVTWTVKVPAAEGVPDRTPAELSVTLAGREPEEADHAYGGLPPDAESCKPP
jgi:hypothetical protein